MNIWSFIGILAIITFALIIATMFIFEKRADAGKLGLGGKLAALEIIAFFGLSMFCFFNVLQSKTDVTTETETFYINYDISTINVDNEKVNLYIKDAEADGTTSRLLSVEGSTPVICDGEGVVVKTTETIHYKWLFLEDDSTSTKYEIHW